MHGLSFPKVRSLAADNAGVISFDMNYIPDRTIADAVINGGTFDPIMMVKAVERLMWLFTMDVGHKLAAGHFEANIGEIAQRVDATLTDPVMRWEIKNCVQMLLARDRSGIPESLCHGDLTLENILLTAGKSIAFNAPSATRYLR